MIRLSVVLTLLCSLISTNAFAGESFYELFTTPLQEGETSVTRFARAAAYLNSKQTKLKEQHDRCKKLAEHFPPSPPGSSAQQAIVELNSLRSTYLARSGHLTCLQGNFTRGILSIEYLSPTFSAALAGQVQKDPMAMAQAKLDEHRQAASFFETLVFEHLMTTGNRDLITAGRLSLKYEQDKVESWSERLNIATMKKLLDLNTYLMNQKAKLEQDKTEALTASEKAKRELAEAYKQNQSLKEANGQLLLNLQLIQAQSGHDIRLLKQTQSAQEITRLTQERDEAIRLANQLKGANTALSVLNTLLEDDDDNDADE